ncbi:MAG TPA: TIR domain-containing protein [bacterium]|nr:TIR domain-containing protein [bacterium]
MAKHKVFISYHHANDQYYKELLLHFNDQYDIFIDASVDTGDIADNLDDQTIRQKIRDEYLKDSTVTIVLVGLQTKYRKHVDWEIYSSMHNGKVNKQSGIFVINLPDTRCTYYTAAHGDNEKRMLYPETGSWASFSNRSEFEEIYPYMPDRIIDNLLSLDARISVTNWDNVMDDVEKLRFLLFRTINSRHMA